MDTCGQPENRELPMDTKLYYPAFPLFLFNASRNSRDAKLLGIFIRRFISRSYSKPYPRECRTRKTEPASRYSRSSKSERSTIVPRKVRAYSLSVSHTPWRSLRDSVGVLESREKIFHKKINLRRSHEVRARATNSGGLSSAISSGGFEWATNGHNQVVRRSLWHSRCITLLGLRGDCVGDSRIYRRRRFHFTASRIFVST